MQQSESVAAKQSECDTAVSHVISGCEELLLSMNSLSNFDETVLSGGGSVIEQSVPTGHNS